jgi:hypothetical protein
MTDPAKTEGRELLEMAAKAAGVKFFHCMTDWPHQDNCCVWNCADLCDCGAAWNPLTDDGDALRLAVKLGIEVVPNTRRRVSVAVHSSSDLCTTSEDHGSDPDAATRRAIVRAAAEIGKAMP